MSNASGAQALYEYCGRSTFVKNVLHASDSSNVLYLTHQPIHGCVRAHLDAQRVIIMCVCVCVCCLCCALCCFRRGSGGGVKMQYCIGSLPNNSLMCIYIHIYTSVNPKISTLRVKGNRVE